jgi:hypothetical protein
VAKKSVDLQDAIAARLNKAQGICALASLLPSSRGPIPDDALPHAMWAARDLLKEVDELVTKLAGHG